MLQQTTEKGSVLLAAQPIYDNRTHIEAVELLYRNDLRQSALDVGEERATSELLLNLCTGITEQVDHFGKPAFINVTTDFLLSQAFLPIEPERVVIELVERIQPDRRLIEAVAEWHRRGFRFALDDFEFRDDWRPLLKYASVIKVDVMQTALRDAARHREQYDLKGCRWLAERVEDQSTRTAYQAAGFDLCQGYFMARPTMIYGKKLNASALQLSRLIGVLFSGEPDMARIVELVGNDPGLSVSLLKVVNSPLYRARQPISSIQGVVMRLGLDNLRRWAVLIASVQASSREQARWILIRAQFCQSLCDFPEYSTINPEQAFMAGLLSGADVLLSVDNETFLRQVCVDETIKQAVLRRSGDLGKLLERALEIEKAVSLKLEMDALPLPYVEAYRQVCTGIQHQLSGV